LAVQPVVARAGAGAMVEPLWRVDALQPAATTAAL
jgi:hypothetical protein